MFSPQSNADFNMAAHSVQTVRQGYGFCPHGQVSALGIVRLREIRVYLGAAAILDGIHTEVVCSRYQDRIFVIVSQFEKIGTLISVHKLSTTEESSARGSQTFSTRTLMGSDEEIWHVYAKQIGALISENSSKPVLLGIALKKHSPQILQQILRLLQANRVW